MRILLAIWLTVAGNLAGATDISAVKAPGVVALMRHALAPGAGAGTKDRGGIARRGGGI